MNDASIAAPPAPHLVVGTAGHIDHGKSRLVRALTGTDPDRLPEERARGMTIELGFAHARLDDCDVWFVDVPGHEKFIRTMVAGATGVDAALLVVAADDSVMPQTREHAEVLRLLGVQRCIVALTKTDLVDDEWADAVEHETRELLAELGLEAAAVIRTSAVTGRGLDGLRAALIAAARRRTADHDPFAWFRLPIDRAFTIAGRGTVVTGSALHGEVSAGDELELWPHGRRVRVRGLQSHHEQRSAACGHMRLAVNLAGVGLDEVWRGCELATPGYLAPTRLVDVRLATLRMPGKTPAQTLRVRLHLATRELRVELRLLDAPQAATVRDAYAQLRLAEPTVASWGQRFILRDDAEQRTLGGGVILRPFARRWTARRPPDPKRLERLVGGKPKHRLEQVLLDAEWNVPARRLLCTRAGLTDESAAEKLLRELCTAGRVRVLVDTPVHSETVERDASAVARRLKRAADANPRWPGVAAAEWPAWMPRACPDRLRPAFAEWVITQGRAALVNGFVLPPDCASAMSPDDVALLDQAMQEIYQAAFQPPALDALACRTPRNTRKLDELLRFAAARGRLRHISAGLWLHADRWDELTRMVTDAIRARGPQTVSDIRNLLQSSRKYVVPICEALDAAGVTRRVGDRRECGPNAPD